MYLIVVLEHAIRIVAHLDLEIDALTAPDRLELSHTRLHNVEKNIDNANRLLCGLFRCFTFGEESMMAKEK